MRRAHLRIIFFIPCVGALVSSIACGGGGSKSNTPPPQPNPAQPLTITTASILPGTLSGHAYSTTLTAINGQGALHWSISPVSPTTLFVNGLSIDPSSGALSGTASFSGTAGFTAQVTDSASPPQTTSKGFTVTASLPLSAASSQSLTVTEFGSINAVITGVQGGIAPLNFAQTGGALPPGLRLNRTTGQLTGTALTTGTFASTITIQDSFTPPETVSQQIMVVVRPPNLSIQNSIPSRLVLNRPFNGSVVATGGTPPYTFEIPAGFGSLPPGIGPLDPNTGSLNGTPSTAGTYSFPVTVTDSSSPHQSASLFFTTTVSSALGRNDSPATATPAGNGFFSASISPYEDPPNGPPVAGDNDYYKVVSLAGATVHVETQAKRFNQNNPLDTVIEIVDGNGIRLNICRQPGDSSLNFTSACLNDDISASPHIQDSALDLQVPGPTNTPITFYLHVLDWRGDARPDMTYSLQVSGVVDPLKIVTSSLPPATLEVQYSQQLFSSNGTGTVAWSPIAGNLPPGLSLSPNGVVTGVPTTTGTYSFSVQATDSGNPPQTATAQEAIQVLDSIRITSSPTMDDACAGQPYTFAVQTAGGVPPLMWSFVSQQWVSISLNTSTGVFSGTTTVTGMFTGTVGVIDATTHGASQTVTLNVKQCGP